MKAKVLDGTALGARLLAQARRRSAKITSKRGRPPLLAIVSSDRPSSKSYLSSKLAACAKAGVEVVIHRMSSGPRTKILGLLADIAADASADALLIETPYPRGLGLPEISNLIPVDKDAEGICPSSYGHLFLSKTWKDIQDLPVPCTARAIIHLLLATRVPLIGRRAVIIGRSATVGRPTAHLLSTLDMTVTLAHSRTKNLASLCREGDVLVLAAGVANLVKASWIKRGAVVLDVGVNSVRGRLVGDAAPNVSSRAGFLSPVPGGVGPLTTAYAVLNTVILAERQALT